MRNQYRNMKTFKYSNKYIRIVKPPKITKKQKKKIMDTPVYKRISLPLEEYINDDLIKPHEKEFVENFTNLGFKIKWICRNREKDDGSYYPTNDFIWNNEEWECKSIFNQKYSSIAKRLRIPILQGKKKFFIYMKNKKLSTKLSCQLANFNIRKRTNQIERLIVLDKESVKEIILQKRK
jgi:hypothetical protein